MSIKPDIYNFFQLEASANEEIFDNDILNLYFFFIQIPYKQDQRFKSWHT